MPTNDRVNQTNTRKLNGIKKPALLFDCCTELSAGPSMDLNVFRSEIFDRVVCRDAIDMRLHCVQLLTIIINIIAPRRDFIQIAK